jgi:hypothetical protein
MTVETASFINGLNASLPSGDDEKNEGDDHLRLIKATIKATFPNITGEVTATQAELNGIAEEIAAVSAAAIAAANQIAHPVGSVYISVVSTSPATLFGFGTWEAFATGRTLVGIDTGNSLMDTVEETFGQADQVNVSHSHGVTDPGHTHTDTLRYGSGVGSGQGIVGNNGGGLADFINSNTTGISVDTAGESGANKNYQPSIVVYMWKRTA